MIDKLVADWYAGHPDIKVTDRTAADRAGRIGGSDVAALMGQNKYSTALQVYLRVMGKTTTQDNMAMRMGRLLEPVIIRELPGWAYEYGYDITNPVGEERGFYNTTRPRLICHPDGYCIYNGQLAGLEVKTGGVWGLANWAGDDMPINYYIQCQTYLMITGLPVWVVAAVISNEFIVRILHPDAEMHEMIGKHADDFLANHIDKEVMPLAIGTEGEADDVRDVIDTGTYYIDDPVVAGMADKAAVATERRKEYEREEREAKTALQQMLIGDTALDGQVRFTLASTVNAPARVVTIREYARTGLDTKRLHAEHGALYAHYAKETMCKVMKIKEDK